MPRVARIVIPGIPHHVYQRGNNRQDVFFTDDDRELYLDLLAREAGRHGLQVLGYCLMTNHVHLIAVPAADDSLAKAVGRTHVVYSQAINRLHGRVGHLWQGRFGSCALDERHLVVAMAYIERNPVRAGICRLPWTYRWSSAAPHAGTAPGGGPLDLAAWRQHWPPDVWRELLRGREDADATDALRRSTTRGRPLGADTFLSKLEARLGRRLRPFPVGRPRKRRESNCMGME
ncbi:MAG TPA: transposase [Planctomycetota bacterium]|nr:transposase [Planctomycetota bacterium]